MSGGDGSKEKKGEDSKEADGPSVVKYGIDGTEVNWTPFLAYDFIAEFIKNIIVKIVGVQTIKY